MTIANWVQVPRVPLSVGGAISVNIMLCILYCDVLYIVYYGLCYIVFMLNNNNNNNNNNNHKT